MKPIFVFGILQVIAAEICLLRSEANKLSKGTLKEDWQTALRDPLYWAACALACSGFKTLEAALGG
jgi:hypothetical protein